MRQDRTLHRDVRANALWGRRGESRSNALWGRSGKRSLLLLSLAAMLVVPVAGSAAPGGSGKPPAIVPSGLLAAGRANPDQSFQVIIQTRGAKGSDTAAKEIDGVRKERPGHAYGLARRLEIIGAASAQLSGAQILDLATKSDIAAITPDAPMVASGSTTSATTCGTCPYEGSYWPWITGVTGFWQKPGAKAVPAPQAPAIAVVDSGIDASNPIFGSRVVKQVTLTQLGSNSPGDGYGHGTYVAGLAAGMLGNSWGGASPTSKLVSLDVMNDQGMALTSDVIAAADWIYQNKDAYGIRVANFSLHSATRSSFMNDPLDEAVEKLWFSGVVVVAAAGNYADNGQPSGVLYAPANDPFVLTVGGLDVNGTPSVSDDFNAPWSSFGYTPDGFAKPELGAPGRFMIGAVPTNAAMPLTHPDRVVAPGFMRMSGTSFAAPITAGAAADLLALHPSWTPDQVKGALMVSAQPISPTATAGSSGVGELKLDVAALVNAAPNPNAALDRYLVNDPNGGPTPVFDAASWYAAATTDPSWDSSTWNDASWAGASWGEASWGDASWVDPAASWGDASWGDASWGDQSGADSSSASSSLAASTWVN
jgi:subtilisin family serine protease